MKRYDEQRKEEIEKLLNEGWQFHYAPLTGSLSLMKQGEQSRKWDGWAVFHEIMAIFLELRKDNKIELAKRENYGHSFFHGHGGQVDIYMIPPKK